MSENISEYRRQRSKFYIKIFASNVKITFSVNFFTEDLIKLCWKELESLSPKGWTKSTNYEDISTLWIPKSKITAPILEYLQNFLEWVEQCHSLLWFKTNRYIEKLFTGDELAFCICSDWTKDFDTYEYTPLGESVHQITQCDNGTNDDFSFCVSHVMSSLKCILHYFDNSESEDLVITILPGQEELKIHMLSNLCEFVAEQLDCVFTIPIVYSTSSEENTKFLDNEFEKVDLFYQNNEIIIDFDIHEKNIIIISDLYQSGASMWFYAEYLKSLGASNVFGISIVKALRDDGCY